MCSSFTLRRVDATLTPLAALALTPAALESGGRGQGEGVRVEQGTWHLWEALWSVATRDASRANAHGSQVVLTNEKPVKAFWSRLAIANGSEGVSRVDAAVNSLSKLAASSVAACPKGLNGGSTWQRRNGG